MCVWGGGGGGGGLVPMAKGGRTGCGGAATGLWMKPYQWKEAHVCALFKKKHMFVP